MVRVSKEKSAENRDAIVRTAGRLVREKGIDGVGVAEIAKEAGLTHGALYAHFPSKDALAVAAFSQGLDRSREAMRVATEGGVPGVADILEHLLSSASRDAPAMSCPMTASASEVGRHGEELSAVFAKGFLEKAGLFEKAMDGDFPDADRRRVALAIVAAEIGAIAVARAVAKSDAALSDEVLAAVRTVLTKAADHAAL